MFGVAYQRTTEGGPFERREIGGDESDEWTSPWMPEWGEPIEASSPQRCAG
jgi:hypothetical protein